MGLSWQTGKQKDNKVMVSFFFPAEVQNSNKQATLDAIWGNLQFINLQLEYL